MSRVIGVACDNCGVLDVEVNLRDPMGEDYFPRKGWVALTQFEGEDAGELAGEDIHVCSSQCLFDFAKRTLETESSEEHGHSHEQD